MVPNIMMVQPPNTAFGKVAKTAPKIGKIPARIMITAPVPMVKRLTTLVMATSPTFWLKDVIGRHPNKDEILLINPSQAMDPAVSFAVTSLPKPEDARAEVSPIVSVADTRKISVTDTMALILNSILNGINCGNETIAVLDKDEKSTIPMGIATI